MQGDQIKFRKGYKYQLAETYCISTSICPVLAVDTEFIALTLEGRLTIRIGYAWDGASGPALDTPSSMRASLVHDALYQLMRQRLLDEARQRQAADDLFRQICLEDGMNRFRADYFHYFVRQFGEPSASPKQRKVVEIAP